MKRFLPAAGWLAIAVALLVSFALDFANVAQGGAIDLRNRVTGVRLLETGVDPYTYKWHNGDPPEYCDPYNNPRLPVSKTTASPALLLVEAPLAWMPYRVGQVFWFLAQWALLLATGAVLMRMCGESWQRWLIAAFIAGFTYTAAWRLHAERGQAYVLLAFVFAGWLTATRDDQYANGFLAGFLAGLLAALRPTFLLLAPFLVLHRRGQVLGVAAGLLLGVGLPMLWNAAIWPDYFAAMQTGATLYVSGIDPPPGPQTFPPRIEGVPTDILGYCVPIPYADFSVQALLRALGAESFPALPILLLALVAYGVWLGLSRRRAPTPLLAALAAWCFLIDLFVPAYRNSYNDVLVLDVIALAVIAATRAPWILAPSALAVVIGWAVYVFSPEQAWLIDLPGALYALTAVLSILISFAPRPGREMVREQ